MRRSDDGAAWAVGAMRRTAMVGAVGLVLVACAGCTPRWDGEYEVTNGTGETFELSHSETLAPGETRTLEVDEDGCIPELEFLTADHTQVANAGRVCDHDHLTLTEDTLRPLAAATIVNDSEVQLLITFTGEYQLEKWPLAPSEDLVIPIMEGLCVTDAHGGPALYADVPSGEGPDHMVLAHTGALCGGTRWVIDDGTLDGGVATVTLHNTTAFPLEARLDAALWASPVRLGAGGSVDVPLGVPVDSCVDDEISLKEVSSDSERGIFGTIAGPLCNGEVTVSAETLSRPDETGTGSVPLTATEVYAAVRVVNRTGGELVVELAGPLPYTVSVDADSVATVLLGVPTAECLDASLRASSVPGSPGATGEAELSGPLCDGDWVVTADVLAAGG